MRDARAIPPVGIRMPEELKLKLKDLAWQNRRSMNSEIVIILEKAVADEPVDTRKPEMLA